jgi:hypothetical protein
MYRGTHEHLVLDLFLNKVLLIIITCSYTINIYMDKFFNMV